MTSTQTSGPPGRPGTCPQARVATDDPTPASGPAAPVKGFPLPMAGEGARLRILALHGGRGMTMRLTELGLNVGAEIELVQRQGGGLLVARGEGRIAIGSGMAAKILVGPA